MSSAAAKKPRREDDKLDADTEAEVTKFLTPGELGRVRQTERRARHRTYRTTKIKVPASLLPLRYLYDDFSYDDYSDYSDGDDQTDELLSLSFWNKYDLKNVTEIDASNSGITTADLRYIAEQCPKLTSLDISGYNVNVPSEAVVPILEQCRNLTTLCIQSITDTAFTASLLTCPKLTFLQLWYPLMTDEGLRAISQRCPNLAHLDLTFAHNRYSYGVITFEGVIALAEGCPRLKYLELGYLKEALNLESLRALAVGCPLLSVLRICINYEREQEELEEWIQECYPLFAQHLQQQLIIDSDYDEVVIDPTSGASGGASGAARQLASQFVSAFGPLRF